MTIHWKAVEQYFAVVLFVFQFYPVCNVGKVITFALGTVRIEKGFSIRAWFHINQGMFILFQLLETGRKLKK